MSWFGNYVVSLLRASWAPLCHLIVPRLMEEDMSSLLDTFPGHQTHLRWAAGAPAFGGMAEGRVGWGRVPRRLALASWGTA